MFWEILIESDNFRFLLQVEHLKELKTTFRLSATSEAKELTLVAEKSIGFAHVTVQEPIHSSNNWIQ